MGQTLAIIPRVLINQKLVDVGLAGKGVGTAEVPLCLIRVYQVNHRLDRPEGYHFSTIHKQRLRVGADGAVDGEQSGSGGSGRVFRRRACCYAYGVAGTAAGAAWAWYDTCPPKKRRA